MTALWRVARSRDTVMVVLLASVCAVVWLTTPRFASSTTAGFLLLDLVATLLIAMPMTLIIITGEIDLSVASIAGLASACLGAGWQAGLSMPMALLLAIVAGAVCGAINGGLITMIGLPSLAVTIGTLALYRGLALVVLGDNAVANFPPAYASFATARFASGIPHVMVPVTVLVLGFIALLHATPAGRALYAMGNSAEAARFTGINVARSKFYLYLTSGVVSAFAGVFWTLRYSSARSDNAIGLELTVVAAVLLGGVSIFGGSGTLLGVLCAVGTIGVINYALRLNRVSDVVLVTITGALLIASVLAPSLNQAIRELRQRRRPSGTAQVASTVTIHNPPLGKEEP